MNRLILSLTLLAAGMLPAAAQHYRGFFDATVNLPLSNSNGLEFMNTKGLTYGATTSHGVQLRNVFVGIGAGILLTGGSENVGVPVFAEVRYDLFTNRKATFFAGCKVGYALSMKEYGYYMEDSANTYYKEVYDDNGTYIGYHSHVEHTHARYNGLLIQPSAGVRFRLTHTLGINLTLSYLPVQMETDGLEIYDWYLSASPTRTEIDHGSKFWSHRIALSVGIDF